MNEWIRTAQSAVLKNLAERSFFFATLAAKSWKRHMSRSLERAFPKVFGNSFCCWTPSKTEGFQYTTIYSLLGNWCYHSVESRALPFKQSDLRAWSLLSWHLTHTHLWARLSVFSNRFALHCHGHAKWLVQGEMWQWREHHWMPCSNKCRWQIAKAWRIWVNICANIKIQHHSHNMFNCSTGQPDTISIWYQRRISHGIMQGACVYESARL